MRRERALIGVALAVACLFLSVACRSRTAADWRPVLRDVDSLVSKGDTTAAFVAVRAFLSRAASSAAASFDTSYVAVVDTLALVMSRAGDLRLAEQLYRCALREQESPADESAWLTRLRLMQGLALRLTDLGEFAEAQQVLDSCRVSPPGRPVEQSPAYPEVLSAIGYLRYAQGKYTEADTCWERARDLRLRVMPADDPSVAMLCSNLGNALVALNQPDSAEANYRRALQSFERLRPQRNYEWLAVAINLAALCADQGRYDEARDYYRRAMHVTEETFGPRHPRAADILLNLATIDFELEDWSAAHDTLRRAEDIYRQLPATVPGAQTCEYDLGILFYHQQQWDSAAAHAQRCLELVRTSLGDDSPEGTFPLDLLSQIHLTRREWEAAREDRRAAYRLARDQFISQYVALSETQALAYSEEFHAQTADYLSTLLSCEDTPPESDREIADVALQSKSWIQDAALARQRLLRKRTDSRSAARWDSLQALRNRISQFALSLKGLPASPAMQNELASLRKQAAVLEKQVVKTSPLHRELVDVPLDSIHAALRRLPGGTVVVDYLAFSLLASDFTYQSHYLAVVFRNTGFAACVPLGNADDIEKRVRRYREYLSQPRFTTADQINRASRAVYDAVWRPVEPYVGSAHLVLICPDGDLNTVSFAGLPDDSGHYLIERYAVQYLSTPRDLVRAAPDSSRAGKGILLVGDPDYQGQLPKLRYAAQELSSALESWRSSSPEPAQTLVGEAASERNFRRDCAGKRILYVAAHSTDIPAIAEGDRSADASGNLLRSGIVLSDYRLSGATVRDPQDDGVLTADEISALNCEGTELAVLSLCESGSGTVVTGEGVYGLRRAFQLAGVQTIVSTLWSVDDRASAEVMKYGLFDSTASYPENLQRMCTAQIAAAVARRETPNPFTWAAFVCTGGWRRSTVVSHATAFRVPEDDSR